VSVNVLSEFPAEVYVIYFKIYTQVLELLEKFCSFKLTTY
jgi:hypothetical protein